MKFHGARAIMHAGPAVKGEGRAFRRLFWIGLARLVAGMYVP
ncbi:hypothetical protein NY78_3864 [Desulfovibrio sp. TomC]|nr:hypothetical protein NY78_3864 [Desulfovibrio sp. TomC]